MKPTAVFSAAWTALTVVTLAGCCHAEYTLRPVPEGVPAPEGYKVVAAGTARNSGYYLFNRWALYSGHPLYPNTGDYRAFRDDIRPDRNAQMLLTAMRRHCGAEKLEHAEHQEQSWGYFSLFLVWRRTIVTTAVGVRWTGAAKRAETAPEAGISESAAGEGAAAGKTAAADGSRVKTE